jgi:hypothetical protein
MASDGGELSASTPTDWFTLPEEPEHSSSLANIFHAALVTQCDILGKRVWLCKVIFTLIKNVVLYFHCISEFGSTSMFRCIG